MTINNLSKILPKIMSLSEVPILVGHAGVGKTEVIKSIGRKYNREVIVLSLSQMEPGDLIGMPARDGNKTIWLRPEWWPKDENTILFLDEINRSHETVRAAIMQLLLDRRLNTHVLPKGTWLVAAMNPETDNYDVNSTIDQAYIDRFIWIKVVNKFDEWKHWVYNNKECLNEMYLAILTDIERTDSEVFQMGLGFDLPNIVPTPRAHIRAMKIINNLSQKEFELFGLELLKGIIGQTYGPMIFERLMNHFKDTNQLAVSDLLNFNEEKIKTSTTQARINVINRLISYLLEHDLTTEEIDKLTSSLKLFKNEEISILIRESTQNKNFNKVFKELQKNDRFFEFVMSIITDDLDSDSILKVI